MEAKYNHSVKVPTQYRAAARLLKKTFEEGASLKGLIFQEKHARTNRLYALIQKISDHKHVLDRLIDETKLREKEPRLEKYLCAVLMTELLFGNGQLNGESKPVQCIRGYEQQFRALLDGGSADAKSGADGGTAASAVVNGDGGGGGDAKPMGYKKEFEKPRYVRVNTNLMSRADALELFVKDGWIERPFAADTQTYDEFLAIVRTLDRWDFVSDMHVKNLFVFPPSSRRFWARNELVRESKLVLQDKASCLPTVLLNPPRGATILDMCAAPGMKTSHLAAHIKNKGTIYAVEQHVRRYGTLCEIMANTKSSASVQTINQDALALQDEGVPGVEYILVDPSCSGSGMTGRLFSTPEDKEAERLVLLSGLQMRMLQHAMRAFHSARKIVYSTCSVHVEENEQVVARSLEACPDWELVKPEAFAERWKNFGSAKWKHVGKKCFYAKPEVDMTDGFFVAVFERRVVEGGEERVHDPDRVFLEQIHRNFAGTVRPTEGRDWEEGEEENGDGEWGGGRHEVGNPFGVKKEVGVEKYEEQVPMAVVDVQTTFADGAGNAIAEPVKEKKKKKNKTVEDVVPEAEPSVADEPPKKKKKSKHQDNVAEVVEPLAEPVKEKKQKKSKNVEDVVPEASVADEPTKKKKKSKHQDKVAESEAHAESIDAIASDDAPKKKKKRDRDIVTDEAAVPSSEPTTGESPAKKKKKKKVKSAEE